LKTGQEEYGDDDPDVVRLAQWVDEEQLAGEDSEEEEEFTGGGSRLVLSDSRVVSHP
jgi:hypothetical protein